MPTASGYAEAVPSFRPDGYGFRTASGHLAKEVAMQTLNTHFPILTLFKTLAMGILMAVLPQPLMAQTGAPQDIRAGCRQQADAKGLRSGTERQAFMRQCVHGTGSPVAKPAQPAVPAQPPAAAKPAAKPTPPAAATPPAVAPPPPDRMTECNKQATDKGLRGPARRDFMRQCMRP